MWSDERKGWINMDIFNWTYDSMENCFFKGIELLFIRERQHKQAGSLRSAFRKDRGT